MPEFAHKYNTHMLLMLHFIINFHFWGNIHYLYVKTINYGNQ